MSNCRGINNLNSIYQKDATLLGDAMKYYNDALNNYGTALSNGTAQSEVTRLDGVRKQAEVNYTALMEAHKSKHDLLKRLIQMIGD